MAAEDYPMRINRYMALKGHSTRREADELIKRGRVFVNGRRAELGDKVSETDKVEVRRPGGRKRYRYYAYNKPVGIVTNPDEEHESVEDAVGIAGVFPVGRLDRDSHGLLILSDDGRITDRLLNPDYGHEKEYAVEVDKKITPFFLRHMAGGVDIEGYVTKPSKVTEMGERRFRIVLSEGKKHQIRRMCVALGYQVRDLERIRVMNVRLGGLKRGEHRPIEGEELERFLRDLGLGA